MIEPAIINQKQDQYLFTKAIVSLFAISFLLQVLLSTLIINLCLLLLGINYDENQEGIILVLNILHNIILIIFLRKKVIKGQSLFFNRNKNSRLKNINIIIVASCTLILSAEILVVVNNFLLDIANIERGLMSPYDQFFSTNSVILFCVLVLTVGPVYEELVYRYLVIRGLMKINKNKNVLIFFSSLLFALIHLPSDLLGGSIRYTLIHISLAFLAGIVFGYLLLNYGLISSISVHIIWNAVNLISTIINFSNDLSLMITFTIEVTCAIILVITIVYCIISKKIGKKIEDSFRVDGEENHLDKNKLFLIVINIILTFGYYATTKLLNIAFPSLLLQVLSLTIVIISCLFVVWFYPVLKTIILH